MEVAFCPQCGTKREGHNARCRDCSDDLVVAEQSAARIRTIITPDDYPSSVDVRPLYDRQSIARSTVAASDVRVKGTADGPVAALRLVRPRCTGPRS